jgi:hypothetical protein
VHPTNHKTKLQIKVVAGIKLAYNAVSPFFHSSKLIKKCNVENVMRRVLRAYSRINNRNHRLEHFGDIELDIWNPDNPHHK